MSSTPFPPDTSDVVPTALPIEEAHSLAAQPAAGEVDRGLEEPLSTPRDVPPATAPSASPLAATEAAAPAAPPAAPLETADGQTCFAFLAADVDLGNGAGARAAAEETAASLAVPTTDPVSGELEDVPAGLADDAEAPPLTDATLAVEPPVAASGEPTATPAAVIPPSAIGAAAAHEDVGDPEPAAPEPAAPEPAAPEPAADVTPALFGAAAATAALPDASTPPHLVPPRGGQPFSARPLTEAIDTAAKLAADANAAAEALDSLKRLLQQGLPARQTAPRVAINGEPRRELALPPKPPPVPAVAHDRQALAPLPSVPPPLPPTEATRFDVRGFLAGFALSAAIGVVLYLFMTAG